MNVKFKHLALGARFRYPEDYIRVFVKLSHKGDIAEWNNDECIICHEKQVILPINPETDVHLYDQYSWKTDHVFPKTAHQEGVDAYYSYKIKCHENPYEEGSQAYNDWDDGWNEADWDDCE